MKCVVTLSSMITTVSSVDSIYVDNLYRYRSYIGNMWVKKSGANFNSSRRAKAKLKVGESPACKYTVCLY